MSNIKRTSSKIKQRYGIQFDEFDLAEMADDFLYSIGKQGFKRVVFYASVKNKKVEFPCGLQNIISVTNFPEQRTYVDYPIIETTVKHFYWDESSVIGQYDVKYEEINKVGDTKPNEPFEYTAYQQVNNREIYVDKDDDTRIRIEAEIFQQDEDGYPMITDEQHLAFMYFSLHAYFEAKYAVGMADLQKVKYFEDKKNDQFIKLFGKPFNRNDMERRVKVLHGTFLRKY